MRKYKYKEVVKKEKVLVNITCDVCCKEICEENNRFYFKVRTSHNCWRNDSIESIVYLDFCSYECLSQNMTDYFDEARDTFRYEIERSDY